MMIPSYTARFAAIETDVEAKMQPRSEPNALPAEAMSESTYARRVAAVPRDNATEGWELRHDGHEAATGEEHVGEVDLIEGFGERVGVAPRLAFSPQHGGTGGEGNILIYWIGCQINRTAWGLKLSR